ncbi:hypothetical protein [uncultured Tateyamaria sp.]|uniref:hypothetical protein n=1 Tax=Tateyamaria sp. 1078 TaxID=3417464 RepID=UPI0026143D58|nr:hypothetical protein [uncultured Tateyamaria sp.]
MTASSETRRRPKKTLDYSVSATWTEDEQNVLSETWQLNGLLHRLHGPALTEWSERTGNTIFETWFLDGQEHRDDGPAIIEYDEFDSRRVTTEIWKQNGQLHRKGGPAIVEYGETGNVALEEWWLHGQRLR